jgi:hypothetical protein
MIQGENNKTSLDKFASLVHKCIAQFRLLLRHRRAKKQDNLYLSLVKDISKRELTPNQQKSINDLFSKYVKIRYNSHIFYTASTGFFSEKYIPDSLWTNYIDQYYNDWAAANVIDNKVLYLTLFADVKQPKMIVYRSNGFWYNEGGKIIEFDKAINLIMSQDDCFIKRAQNSWGGKGVFYFSSNTNNVDYLIEIINRIPVDIVVQESIKQSSTLSRLNSDSVNTVRILSFLSNNGTVKIYSSILRMGIAGAKVDNASSGGISCGIQEDGRLKNKAYSNTGILFYEHPSSKVKFDDICVPNFSKMKDLVNNLHPKFPHFRMIGWDIACDYNDDPILIEANFCDSELDFHQLNNGPIFSDDIEMILSEVFKK